VQGWPIQSSSYELSAEQKLAISPLTGVVGLSPLWITLWIAWRSLAKVQPVPSGNLGCASHCIA
jgi:hypothetical protein